MAKPSPLTPELLGVRKGAASPAASLPAGIGGAAPDRGRGAGARGAPPPVMPPPIMPPPGEEPRIALTVRLPISTLERLREAAHRTRIEKQSIAEEALRTWLDGRGF